MVATGTGLTANLAVLVGLLAALTTTVGLGPAAMAADPVKRVAHLRASAMLDMTAVPVPLHGHA